ncbi:MAG: endonuclease domain-containing protein [Saprospiraceae bacterium]
MTSASRQLRRTMTEAETIIWSLVRNRRLNNYKFLRQHPFTNTNPEIIAKFFVVDFYCAELKLALEIDGFIHNDQLEYDKIRTIQLNDQGIKVIRISNEIVLRDDFDQNELWVIIQKGLKAL